MARPATTTHTQLPAEPVPRNHQPPCLTTVHRIRGIFDDLFTPGALTRISHQTLSDAPGGSSDFAVARTGSR